MTWLDKNEILAENRGGNNAGFICLFTLPKKKQARQASK
jgi:hypothetical protein